MFFMLATNYYFVNRFYEKLQLLQCLCYFFAVLRAVVFFVVMDFLVVDLADLVLAELLLVRFVVVLAFAVDLALVLVFLVLAVRFPKRPPRAGLASSISLACSKVIDLGSCSLGRYHDYCWCLWSICQRPWPLQ